MPFYHAPVILPRVMSRILLTVLFAHLCRARIKILIFTFVTQMQFDTRSPNYFPLAVHQQSQAQRASLPSKWSSLVNTWHRNSASFALYFSKWRSGPAADFNAGCGGDNRIVWVGREVCLGQGHLHLDQMGLKSSSCRVRFALGMSWHQGVSYLSLGTLTHGTPHHPWKPLYPLQVLLEWSLVIPVLHVTIRKMWLSVLDKIWKFWPLGLHHA